MVKLEKQYEVLQWASLFLEKHQREQRVAEILLQHHLHVSRTQFYANMREPIAEVIVNKFKADIIDHVKTGVPFQHLTGHETFYGRDFHVNRNVLIPRPETEELVEKVINHAKDKYRANQPLTIVDVGTGSGAIAISLALELPNAIVYAIDISKEALLIAEKNANALQASVTFLEGDFLKPFILEQKKADIIVSNPPYISEVEKGQLSDTVKNFDPELALFADDNGLAAYKEIISQLPDAIRNDGAVFFEIGYEQGDKVQSLLQHTFPESATSIIQDINGKDRIVSAKLAE